MNYNSQFAGFTPYQPRSASFGNIPSPGIVRWQDGAQQIPNIPYSSEPNNTAAPRYVGNSGAAAAAPYRPRSAALGFNPSGMGGIVRWQPGSPQIPNIPYSSEPNPFGSPYQPRYSGVGGGYQPNYGDNQQPAGSPWQTLGLGDFYTPHSPGDVQNLPSSTIGANFLGGYTTRRRDA